MTEQQFELTRTFLQQVYEVEDDAEFGTKESQQDEEALAAICSKLGLHPDPEQGRVARHVVSCLMKSSAVTLIGPPTSGKSTIIKLVHSLMSGPASCRREYLHFASYTEAELMGDSTTDGVISSILEAGEEDQGLLLHLDGRLPESLALPLSLLADSRQFMDGSGRKQVTKYSLQSNPRFLDTQSSSCWRQRT